MDRIANLDIRPARDGDLPALLALYRQLNPDDPKIEERDAAARFQQMVDHPGMTIFIACVNDVIENVVTHADHRQRGYAGALIEKAIAAAWGHGCFKVMLLTGSTEAATLRFYANCGFSQNKTGFQIRRS